MPKCIVPGCTSGYKSNLEKLHFFSIPKDYTLLELWRRAVKRDDVKSGGTVCEKHFLKTEITWHRQHFGADGNVFGVTSYKIPRLIKGSVPSIFPWIEENTSIKTNVPQKVRDKENKENANSTLSAPGPQQHEEPLDCQETDTTRELPGGGDETVANVPVTFDQLSATGINLPPGWLMQKRVCEAANFIFFCIHESVIIEKVFKTFVLKAVTVTSDLSIQITVLGKLVDITKLNVPSRVTDVTELQELLHTIDGMNVCKGCTGSSVIAQIKNLNCSTVSQDVTLTWRHHKCRLLLSNITSCMSCRTTQKTLAAKLRRWKTGTTKRKRNRAPNSPTQKKKMIGLQGKLRATRISKSKTVSKYNTLKEKLKLCQEKMARCDNLNTDELLKSGKISENQIHVLQHIIDAAKHTNSEGRNYSEEWMLLCMLLHMRSSSGYEFLRRNEILPLPCVRTIRRYLWRINARCGFDLKFFEVFKAALAKKDKSQRHGILLLDEMSTRESVAVDSVNLSYRGLVDFGDDEQQCSDFSQKANHGLVLMFHALNDTFTQPIAVFASKGPVKGDALAKIIIKAIILLERIDAKVHGVVTDGAASNRKFWSEVGANGTRKQLRNYFDHPAVEGRKVFIFSDTPHLIKTIRNRLHNNGETGLQMTTTDPLIKWQYIRELHEKDRQLVGPGQLLVCPKLTLDHVNLNNASKMRVRLATQVFSNSVAVGLRYYRRKIPELEGCEATASFCKWINDMFDALNRTRPKEGVKVGNADYKMIEESLRKLDAWEENVESKKLSPDLFLTRQTAAGLRVTLQSSLDLIRYLTEHCGFEYVLTGRVNQDPLERFFGTVRQAGGCNDHPTTPTFLNIYKILSTYSVLKPPKAGNCSISSVNPTRPLVTLAELKSIYSLSSSSENLSRTIKQKLEQIVKHDEWQFEEFVEHDYCMPEVKDCVLYCLTADLTKRVINTVKCSTCKNALVVPDANGVILPEAVLTNWQQRGDLTHPNSRLFRFVLFLESKFETYCQSTNVFEDIIEEVLKYEQLSFPCPLHAHEIIYQITQYFVRMRMQQHCQRLKAEQRKENQLKKKSSRFCVT